MRFAVFFTAILVAFHVFQSIGNETWALLVIAVSAIGAYLLAKVAPKIT